MSMRSVRVIRFLVLSLGFVAGARAFAGSFDSFVLAMSDENDFCAANPSKIECKTGGAASFGMALHGLWPDKNNDPQHTFQYCGTVTSSELGSDWCAASYDIRSQLTAQTYADLAAVMPGTESCLYNHEWYAHGTCSGMTPDAFFEDAQELASRFIALQHFHGLISANAGKTVSKAQLIAALTADLGAGAESVLVLDCRKDPGGSAKESFSEVDLALDTQSFMQFPAAESLSRSASKDTGNCPAQGILITPPSGKP